MITYIKAEAFCIKNLPLATGRFFHFFLHKTCFASLSIREYHLYLVKCEEEL
ncbi:hypothetical protein MY9_0945 [Bacillus sp. JS]|nr:hypothetical protein MY9_0945 [Bacillus sp. JS]